VHTSTCVTAAAFAAAATASAAIADVSSNPCLHPTSAQTRVRPHCRPRLGVINGNCPLTEFARAVWCK
jgi:hypothetical protein